MKKPKRSVIWVVEDDKTFQGFIKGFIKGIRPKAAIKVFPDAYRAALVDGTPDVILLDVAGMTGGIGPVGFSSHGMTSIAHSLLDKHPGAVVGMYSCVGEWASDIVNDLKSELKDSVIEELVIHSPMSTSIKDMPEKTGFQTAVETFVQKYTE